MISPAAEPQYPSLAEVECISTPSSLDAFCQAEEDLVRVQTRRRLLLSSKQPRFRRKGANTKPRSCYAALDSQPPAAAAAAEAERCPTASTATQGVTEDPRNSSLLSERRKAQTRHGGGGGFTHQHQQWIEVTPGVNMHLYGINETLKAIRQQQQQQQQQDNSTGSSRMLLAFTYCLVCGNPMYCLEYANLVVCSACNVISPNTRYRHLPHHSYSGVAIGLSEYEYQALLDELCG